MATCWQCGAELPGNEQICRECYGQRYKEVVTGRKYGLLDELKALRDSPLTVALVVVNIALFVAMALSAGTESPPAEQLKKWGADFGPLTLNGQWWRLFTAAFVHANFGHVWFNMLGLLALGSIAEKAYGKAVLIGAYLATILAASCSSVVWHPAVVAVGASGGVFGLLGFLVPPIAMRELSLFSRHARIPVGGFALCAAYNLIIGALVPFIDNAAHIGGFIAGLFLGLMFAFFGRRVKVQLHRDST